MTNLFGNPIYRNILAGTQFGSLAPYVATNRKAFFSFHKPDDFRVNVVRKTFQFRDRSDPNFVTFYDSSLWEKRKLTNPEAIKNIIRYGVSHTSAVCVLAGSFTWSRPWVRYEIARSVIDGKGLLTVHINSINHHQLRVPHIRGPNPLAYMGVGKMPDGTFRLYEWRAGPYWEPYSNYTYAVELPRYLPEPPVGWVVPLTYGTAEYDFVFDAGSRNIGWWFDFAAKGAGR